MPRRGSSKPPAEPVVKPYGCDLLANLVFMCYSISIGEGFLSVQASAKSQLHWLGALPGRCVIFQWHTVKEHKKDEFTRGGLIMRNNRQNQNRIEELTVKGTAFRVYDRQ